MKVDGHSGSDWGFQVPPEGRSTFVILEGLRNHISETTQKESFAIPIERIDENEERTGEQMTIYLPFSKFGETKLADILVCTKMAKAFEKRFPDDTEIMDQDVLEACAIKLPGRIFDAEISHQKSKKDPDIVFPQVDKIFMVGDKNTKTKKSTENTKAKVNESSSDTDDDEWPE